MYNCWFFNIIVDFAQFWNISFSEFHEHYCVFFNILFKIEILLWRFPFVLLFVFQYNCWFCSIMKYFVFRFSWKLLSVFNILFKLEILLWRFSFVLLYVSQYFVHIRNVFCGFPSVLLCVFQYFIQLSYFPAAPEATGSYPEESGSLCFPVPPRTLGINQTDDTTWEWLLSPIALE